MPDGKPGLALGAVVALDVVRVRAERVLLLGQVREVRALRVRCVCVCVCELWNR